MTVGISSLVIIWGTLICGIWLLFHAMEETSTTDTKRICADRIKSIAAKSTSQTIVESPRWFIEAFDRIFGDRHLTWRCFLRSCVASMMAVSVMTIMWAVLDINLWQSHLLLNQGSSIIVVLFAAFVFNLVPDYISPLETRWILRRVSHAGLKKFIAIVVLDVIITGGIFVCGVGIIVILISYIEGYPMGVSEIAKFFNEWILLKTFIDMPFGIFFYSTYFTSVWLYLFIAASIATKLLYSLGRTGNRVMASLKIEEKPFQSMGLVVVGLLTLVFAIYAIMNIVS